MKLYKIREGTYRPGGFGFASGYGAIDDLWFLSPAHSKSFSAFWKINPKQPGLSIEPNAKNWPDFLGNGNSPPMFFVAGRVVESLRSIGAISGRVTEMPIAEINAKALRRKPAPKYYVVETKVGIELDLIASGFEIDADGHAIVDPLPQPWPPLLRHRLDSWNGVDLFACRDFDPTDGPYIEMLCTERVKELAEREGWTNVRFETLALV